MKPDIFIDTSYILALFNKDDAYHDVYPFSASWLPSVVIGVVAISGHPANNDGAKGILDMNISAILKEMLERYPHEYARDNKVSSLYYKDLKQRVEQTFTSKLSC